MEMPGMSDLLDRMRSMPPELLEQLRQEGPEQMLQRLGMTQPVSDSTMGVRDVRKAAEVEAPAIYAEVLASYCHPDAVREYEKLRAEEREKLLKALRVTVEENFQHFSFQMMQEQLLNKASSLKARNAVKDSPLVRALRLVMASELLYPEALEAVEATLHNWGRKMPRDLHVMQFMMGYQNHMLKFKDRGNKEMWTQLRTNSTIIKPEASTSQPRKWAQLQPMGISALRLFGVATGRVLVGKLIVPPMVTVGITTLLQDDLGEVIQLGLYNQLPGSASGHQAQELAEKQFCKGAKLQIAEPFLKIFKDGNQGIRVDSPHDIRLETPGTAGATIQDLQDFRQSGNELYKNGQFEAALLEYWRGLRACDEIAVLLSNRSQAHLKTECWAEACRDSAASLLLRPQGAKHRARYVLILQGLGFPDLAQRAQNAFSDSSMGRLEPSIQDTQAVLRLTLKVPHLRTGGRSEEDSASLKEKGNMAFREGKFSEAATFYTQALEGHPAAEEVANLLRNVALSSTRAGLLHDAVAAAAASLRLQFHAKAVYHLAHALALLGELELSEEVLSQTGTQTGTQAALTQLTEEVATTKGYVSLKYPSEMVAAAATMCRWPGKFMVDWVSEAIVIERVARKGRGVRSLRDIAFGETLIIQRPRGSVSTDATKGELLTSTDTNSGLIDDASKVKLTSQLTSMASKDQLLAKVLSNLEDGTGVERPVMSFHSFLDSLQASVLPLLLQQAEFFSATERLELSYARIQGVVNVNVHGDSKESMRNWQAGKSQANSRANKLLGGSTALYPAVSMINHSNEPNCVLLPFFNEDEPKGMAVSARRHISRGEELTLAYLDDPEAVKAKWGIS